MRYGMDEGEMGRFIIDLIKKTHHKFSIHLADEDRCSSVILPFSETYHIRAMVVSP